MIEWDDAYSEVGWEIGDNNAAPARCVSVGRVLKETEDSVVLCGSWGKADPETNERMVLPLGWIVTRKVLI